MARIPANLSVQHTIYEESYTGGFGGPGDAETGLFLYQLDPEDARRLLKISAHLTDGERIREAMGRRPTKRDYGEWHTTPFIPALAGRPWDRNDLPNKPIRLAPILARGGAFGIEIDPVIARQVDAILNGPGAYYATGEGSSLIVVAPEQALIVFAYAG